MFILRVDHFESSHLPLKSTFSNELEPSHMLSGGSYLYNSSISASHKAAQSATKVTKKRQKVLACAGSVFKRNRWVKKILPSITVNKHQETKKQLLKGGFQNTQKGSERFIVFMFL